MKKTVFVYILSSALFVSLNGNAQNYLPQLNDSRMKVKPSIPIKTYAFDLSEVTLSESIFKTAMKADEAYLLTIDPDRLLSGFRANAGLTPKAKIYGGWEDGGLAGHSLGHYLSALSMQFSSSRNPVLLQKVNYIINQLEECQKARGNGYLGAFANEDKIWGEVAKGNIKTGGFDLNGGWAPWYTVHKIMAGLLDAYLYTNNKKALAECIGLANWTETTIKGLNDELLQKMLICEYGGMAETLTNLYAITANQKFLNLSYKFYDKRILDPLSEQKDILPGKHSNTQIPKIIASARRYELTGDKNDKAIADFFWKTVVYEHSYVTGGNSNYEYLSEPNQLNDKLTENTTETCNTYNMLKLTGHLFTQNPSAAFFDYYERALYNHILASQNHENGMTCYFVPLRMGGKKEYSDKFNTFTCCVGTGMENHVKYNESIYFKGENGSLYVNLFIPSVLNWKEKGLKLTQGTSLPSGNETTFVLSLNKPSYFTINLRKPKWAKDTKVLVNGVPQQLIQDEYGYLNLTRTWKNNDKISYLTTEYLYTESMPDNPDRRAVFYGPILLAGILGDKEPDPVQGVPVFVSEVNDASKWLHTVNQQELKFETKNIAHPHEVTLIPFYQTKNQYYSVYWDVFTPEKWIVQQKRYEEQKRKLKEIEDRTVDLFRLGEMQPERDHNFIAEKEEVGQEHGGKWRLAGENGFLQFDVKVDSKVENTIIASYWGMDNRGRNFDIMVDGQKIVSENLDKYKESRFYDVSYKIPLDITSGKSKVTVKLVPKPKNSAGPIYLLRIIKPEM
ncbi:glycoside hydrolase family 127 protein [Pedobacter sp. LMG 31464]|uniref:Glycoside hydrolase family 127 protein n=1 Tax=Pedobacter planticolens TaxID=2679964 RepID=A0A923DXG0_9SPHI|nr:beta-L-arabinofuranosidase domain-containing protein [Pedobacter planticolens]MBB2144880.1 glycoside hydrolase family 127 protein [Pedobacter planticolens]